MPDQKSMTRGKRTLSKAQRTGADRPTPRQGSTTTTSRRQVVREIERSHAVPPRNERNKERTNATVRAKKQAAKRAK